MPRTPRRKRGGAAAARTPHFELDEEEDEDVHDRRGRRCTPRCAFFYSVAALDFRLPVVARISGRRGRWWRLCGLARAAQRGAAADDAVAGATAAAATTTTTASGATAVAAAAAAAAAITTSAVTAATADSTASATAAAEASRGSRCVEERPQYPLLGLLQTQLLVAAEYARRKACAAVLEGQSSDHKLQRALGLPGRRRVHVLEPSPVPRRE